MRQESDGTLQPDYTTAMWQHWLDIQPDLERTLRRWHNGNADDITSEVKIVYGKKIEDAKFSYASDDQTLRYLISVSRKVKKKVSKSLKTSPPVSYKDLVACGWDFGFKRAEQTDERIAIIMMCASQSVKKVIVLVLMGHSLKESCRTAGISYHKFRAAAKKAWRSWGNG